MTLIYTSDNNRELAEKIAQEYDVVEYASPRSKGVNHWAKEVVIIGIHPAIEKRYAGICPIRTVVKEPKGTQIITPNA